MKAALHRNLSTALNIQNDVKRTCCQSSMVVGCPISSSVLKSACEELRVEGRSRAEFRLESAF